MTAALPSVCPRCGLQLPVSLAGSGGVLPEAAIADSRSRPAPRGEGGVWTRAGAPRGNPGPGVQRRESPGAGVGAEDSVFQGAARRGAGGEERAAAAAAETRSGRGAAPAGMAEPGPGGSAGTWWRARGRGACRGPRIRH